MKPHLSNSALDMLSKCGEMYRQRYIEGRRRPPAIAAVVGKGVDRAVDENMESKRDLGVLVDPVEYLDAAREGTVDAWMEEGVRLAGDELATPETRLQGEAIDKAVRLAELHFRQIAPWRDPVHVQRVWTLELDGFPFDLTGRIDLQEPGRIRDLKTAGKSPSSDEARVSDQLTLYAMAGLALDGEIPRVGLDTLVDLKKGPKAVVLEAERTRDDFRVMLRRIEVAAEAIQREVFVPARQSDWWCSARWCGYTDVCPYFRRSARPKS